MTLLPVPSRRSSRRGALLRAAAGLGGLAVLLASAACDSGGLLPGPGTLDYGLLFTAPTDADLEAIQADWDGRSNPAVAPAIVASAVVVDTASTDTTATLYVVSHTQSAADGSTFTHYGLVRIPEGAADFGVVVVHHDSVGGFSVSSVLDDLALFPNLIEATVQVVPAYRSETIVADVEGLAGTFTAGGAPSPWDYDVDDAIALLNAVLELFPDETDDTRLGAFGHGRGGTTALLHGVRDDRLLAVVEYAGPADLANPSASVLYEAGLGAEPDTLAFPAIEYLTDTVLRPLVDEAITYDEARVALVRRSPGFFGGRLPDTQVHHHVRDPVVPFALAEAFRVRLEEEGYGAPEVFDYNDYREALPSGVATQHEVAAMPSSFSATQRFFLDRFGETGSAP